MLAFHFCRTHPYLPVLMLILALAAACPGTSVTITLREEPGVYTGCQDTCLSESNTDFNYGDYDYLRVWHDAEQYYDKTTLIYFNLGTLIPSSACIKSAKLKLYQYNTSEMSSSDWLKIGCYRLLKSWEEGTGGTENGATWLQRWSGTSYPWARIGARKPISGDSQTDPDKHRVYSEAGPWYGIVDDAQTCTTATTGTYVVWDVTPSVQYWHAHSGTNFGWVLDKWWEAPGGYSYDDDSDVDFRSRDYATIGQRPVLEIEYIVPGAETPVNLRLADLNLTYWQTDPLIYFDANNGEVWCHGTTSDSIWGVDGAATNYTINSSFEASALVRLQQGIVGVEQGEFMFGMYQPGSSKHIRLLAWFTQYYEISGMCVASGNGHYHDGSAYWSSYWDDDYPAGPPSSAVRFFSQTAENEETTYLTWKIRYDKPNGMFYVFVNNVLVTYYSKVDFTNWVLSIAHDNNRPSVPTQVWTDFPDSAAPTPNPMTWVSQPTATGQNSISMTCSTATDWGHPPVWYYFNETTGGGHSSSWQSGTTHSDSPLSPNTQYGYQAKAADSFQHPLPNETGYSSTVLRYTWIPAPTGCTTSNVQATTVDLQAQGSFPNLAFGQTGVQFSTTLGEWTGSWKIHATADQATGLTPNTQYTFRVRSQNGDAIGTNFGAGQPHIRTLAAQPGAMAYNPVGCQAFQANWSANGNPPGTEYFARETQTGRQTGWTTGTNWILRNLDSGATYHVEVKARNADLLETGWTDLGWMTTNMSVGAVKKVGPIPTVALLNKVVTAVFPVQEIFFIQDYPVLGQVEGIQGICVRYPDQQPIHPAVGQTVDVIGARVYGDVPYRNELQIEPNMVRPLAMMFPVIPNIATGKWLGGSEFGMQPMLYDDIIADPPVPSHGLNYVGMLVQTTGYLTETGDLWFYLDDARLLDDGIAKGIKVNLQGLGHNVQLANYMSVTGVMRCIMQPTPGGQDYNVRELWPRMDTDIMPLPRPE